ncbi:hemicentin-1 isoform X6 [Hermetia illucens]|uniref:hemicentin-1 isoform X6 n=1 Tax=Hermetia illucens TaxID=343691 RepID=UPI0018CC2A7D|nr:hemicentin-1 isoform X6 [Hermetia illucens]
MLMNWIIFGLLCLASSLGGIGVRAYDHEISEQRDHKVLLSCPIDFKACGELHSVKWFKGNTRIAVVSGDGEVATVKDEYMSRMSIDHSPKGPVTSLSIKSLQIADEDVYTCESTFLEPRESCDTSGVYRIDLKVEVPPSAVHILDENGKFVKNGTKYGPLREGHKLKSICEVKATRPVPTVAWYRGGKRLTDSLHVDEQNGLFYVKSELLLIVSRLELGNNIECRVESPSLDDEIITNYLALDLEVPPTSINLTGVEHHTVQGTNVLLECKVHGARPAVTMAWFNASHEIDIRHSDAVQIETKSIEQRDGTYETISDLKFVATRYEDGLKFRCEAQNVVMRDNKDKPLHESLVLEVLYPPVVSVKPENLTVQEGREVLLFCDYEANPATLQSVKWFQNGKLLNLGESNRYEGGNPEHTALLIKESTRYDDGVYTCELANNIGAETSDNEIYLEVQFPPVVNLTMDPDSPMIENDEGNVTLYCNVLEGNPPTLSKVRWFLGGELLKELPECNGDGSDELCNIDPSRLLLQNIGRQFLGNYSCEGLNSAGWGARSKENELIVYYEPGNATIRHNPQIAVKRKSVSFTCSVDDPGFPAATTYHWLRGGRVVHEVTSNLYTVDPVGLDSRTNFTCYAFNAGGSGNSATVLLDVHAAPAFINPLMPYSGVLYSTGNASLTCRVECVPECSISWFKDGVGIDESSDKYYITEKYLEADPATGDFESVLSVLNFNMTAWPQGKFDIYADNANYSCVSTNNSAGPGVRSATYFGIEYPPENTTVSKDIVTVEEDNIPERILCSAKGNPEPLYEWQFNGSVITRGSALIINHKMAKSDAGAYECFAYNKHGRHSAVTNITVTYKPTCEIVRKEIEDEDTLICTAIGNPKEADFHWSIKSENDSIDLGSGETVGESNYLVLEDEFSVTRVYRCVANNSVGAGPYCQIEVAGHLSWWQRWDKITLIILVASVLGVLLALIVLCCVIVCICRRRRRRDKCERDNEDRPPPLPKRNILPSSRNSTNANNISECSTNELLPRKGKKRRTRRNGATGSDNDEDEEDSSIGCRPLQDASNDDRSTNLVTDHPDAETTGTSGGLFERIFGEIFSRQTQSRRDDADASAGSTSHSFADRFLNFFGPSRIFGRQRLERSDSGASNPFATEHRLKGIRCSGVITYKKTSVLKPRIAPSTAGASSSPSAVVTGSSRSEPNNNVNNKSSALGDPLTEPGEYENLPFHGLQTAPNKPLSPADLADDLDYADVDYRSYGPINYKAASIYALVKKQKNKDNGALKEVNENNIK